MIEAKEIVIDTCTNIVTHYATKHEVKTCELKIRIDLEKINSKPVFGIFKNSTFLEKVTLKDIVSTGDVQGFKLLITMSVKDIIKNIFVQSLKQLKINDPKEIFLLLDLKVDDSSVTFPSIGLYNIGQHLWSLPISEVMDATLAQAKQ